MASAQKKTLRLQNGTVVEAQNPMIVSASRSTDIPAFYSDWFFKRLDNGYSVWTNPFNGVPMYITYEDTRFIVFWSKNPRPLLRHLHKLEERGIGCYVQYSLNNYELEGYEPNLPSWDQRIDTFKRLVDRLGRGRVIWRNDPLLLTDRVSMDTLLERLEKTGDALQGYTEKLVFSFVDISCYAKVASNIKKAGIRFVNWDRASMCAFAAKLADLNRKWRYSLATCAEAIDLDAYGIQHNHCVDEELIARIAYKDHKLMEHLGLEIRKRSLSLMGEEPVPQGSIDLGCGLYAVRTKDNKDKGQRLHCGCMKSKDIGQYNTCRHFCVYCYANTSQQKVLDNFEAHQLNPDAATITGERSC
ncbi:MAG: DUF1848 domain-containing protein [Desulfovibrionaceae bacterium]|nr:DUF1848 domain-containing protein [Desulfovibrionaceae bacterium]